MALYAQGLIPARFLTLLSHLTVLILIFFSRTTVVALEWRFSLSFTSICLFLFRLSAILHRHCPNTKKENIDACMTLDWTESEFQAKENQLVIGLAISIAFVIIELIGFLSGVSMFMPLPSLISITGHFGGSVGLSYFIFDQWDCNLFWWIFTFCSVIPAIVEIVVGIKVVALQKF